MELLDLLENRIGDLLERLERLEGENQRLQNELVQGRDTLLAENQSLKAALEEEKDNKAVVLRTRRLTPLTHDREIRTYVAVLLVVVFMVFFPDAVLWLPNLVYGA